MTMQANPTSLSAAVYNNGWTFWHYRHEGEPDGEIYQPEFWAPVQRMLRDGDTITIDMPAAKHQVQARVCRETPDAPIYLRVMAASTLIMTPIRDRERDARLQEYFS